MSQIRSFVVGIIAAATMAVLWLPGTSSAAQVIAGVRAWSSPAAYRGHCPKQINFLGRIQVNPLPGAVLNFHWERNDGAKSPETVVRIKPGQRYVSTGDDWTVGSSGPLQEVLVVNSGNQHIRTGTKPVNVMCR